jgi:SAM-dependent methyltransferase
MKKRKQIFDEIILQSCPLCNFVLEEIPQVKVESQEIARAYSALTNNSLDIVGSDTYFYVCKNCSLGYFNPQLVGNLQMYELLAENDWYYLQDKPEYEITASFLTDAKTVLEYGAGRGFFQKYLRSSVNYVGIELKTDELNSQIKLKSEITENKFDAVVSFQYLEHVPNISGEIYEMWEKVNSGGKLIIVVPSWDSFLKFAHESALNSPPHHLYVFPDSVFYWISRSLEGVKEIKLIHESVADFHKVWALNEKWFKRFRFLFRVKDNIYYSSELEIRLWKYSKIFSLFPQMKPKRGHSIVAIYTKE